MNAVIYIRVSSADQVEGTSLANQEEACRTWCEREGYEVAALFRDEGESAKTADRPGLVRALDYARKNRTDALVVWKVDRLSRSQLDFHQIRALLAGFGVQVKSATETLTDDPAGKLLAGVLAAFAQFDNDVRAERTKSGMRAAAREGCWVWRAPLGYTTARTDGDKPTLALDPERAPLIRRGFELVATGAHSQSDALQRITNRGLRTGSGKKVTPQSWNRMLQSAVYAGWIDSAFIGPERVRGNWEPTVSDHTFALVQQALNGYTAGPRTTDRPDFPLRGFIRCPECDGLLTAQWSRGRSKRYPYYRCYRCGSVCERKEAVEAAFLELLASLRVKSAYVELFRRIALDAWEERHKLAAGDIKRRQDEVARLTARKEKLLDLLLAETIDEDQYRARVSKIETQLALAKIDQRATESETLDLEAVLRFAGSLLSDPGKMWRLGSLEQRQRLQRLLFPEGVTWSEGRVKTVVTCSVVEYLRAMNAPEGGMVPRAGFKPAAFGSGGRRSIR